MACGEAECRLEGLASDGTGSRANAVDAVLGGTVESDGVTAAWNPVEARHG